MKKAIIITTLQIIFGYLVVMVGWDILDDPQNAAGKNFGWVSQLWYSFVALSLLILLSNLLTYLNLAFRRIMIVVQLTLIAIPPILQFAVIPSRSLFYFFAFAFMSLSVLIIERLYDNVFSGGKNTRHIHDSFHDYDQHSFFEPPPPEL